MNEIVLAGCSPISLMQYLKALGAFKLLVEQLDCSARARWHAGNFCILTRASADNVRDFFLHSYRPTPIISPWNGRAGFLEGDTGEESTRKGATTLRAVSNSTGLRFEKYRRVIDAVGRVSVIAGLDRIRSDAKRLEALIKKLEGEGDGQALAGPKEELSRAKRESKRLKDGLLVALRSELDDDFVPWIDACYVVTGGEGARAPLLGSGGNEGSMDLSINHVATLLDLIDPHTDAPAPRSEAMLREALFAETQHLDRHSNIGFLGVAAAGGVNMTTGFEGPPTENPWNCVLVLEGAMLFAASATKKLGSSDKAGPSFPFMVQATLAGSGSLASREKAGPELWLPVWTSPASLTEVASLAAEGRSTLGRRQVETGLDMLEALSTLGSHRGVSRFERFGFYERRGKGYFVTSHLGSFSAPREAAGSFIAANLGQERWLNEFIRFADGDSASARFVILKRRLVDRVFELSGHAPSAADMQSLLALIGEIQHAMSASSKARKAVGPVPRLSERWILTADDGTPEFRIAKALAGLRALPLRAQLFPARRDTDQWTTPDADERIRVGIGRRGRLTALLGAWLERRLWLMQKLHMEDKPLASPAGVMLDDVAAFLADDSMDSRINALLPGFSLCDIPRDTQQERGEGALPAAFGLMKLALTPDRDLRSLGLLAEDQRVPVPAGMLSALLAGNAGNRATILAWRRLRSRGLMPSVRSALPTLAGIDPARAAAALMIPLRWAATATLARALLNEPDIAIASNETTHRPKE